MQSPFNMNLNDKKEKVFLFHQSKAVHFCSPANVWQSLVLCKHGVHPYNLL